MAVREFKLFYSWQSDVLKTKKLSTSCLDAAVKALNKDFKKLKLDIDMNIDRDTRGATGSPAIANMIFEKIARADIFVCDVTCINSNFLNRILKRRLTPNPNVMMELGYAVNHLGWERVICLNDTQYCPPEQMPFDIRGHRILNFSSAAANVKSDLTNTLSKAIKSIITDYDSIVKAFSLKGHKAHDHRIYGKLIEISSETTLVDSISRVYNYLHTTQYYLNIWDKLVDFYRITENHFIDSDLDALMLAFLDELNSFDTLTTTHLHQENRNPTTLLETELDGGQITDEQRFEYEQGVIYRIHKQPFIGETWPEYDNRIRRIKGELMTQAELVMTTWRSLVIVLKQKGILEI